MSDSRSLLRIVSTADVRAHALGDANTQRVLLGGPHNDGSPLLMGITRVEAGHTSQLIRHDTAEICYVIAGAGWMVTDTDDRPIREGDAVLIGDGCWHAIRAGQGALQMLYVFPSCMPPATDVREASPR